MQNNIINDGGGGTTPAENLSFDDYGNSNAIAENINISGGVGGGAGGGGGGVREGGNKPIFDPIGLNEAQEKFEQQKRRIETEQEQRKAADTTKTEQEQEQAEKTASEQYEQEIKDLEKKEREERDHAEMREDTAYQRAIQDMRKAGWNTDGLQPQASPTAARLDSSRSTDAKNRAEQEKDRQLKLKMLYKELEQAVRENRKDRILELTTSIIRLGGTVGAAKLLKK